MKKWIALLLCCLLPLSATAIEISEDQFYEWYDEMAYLVDCVINKKAPLAGADAAIEAMTFCLGMMESAETGEIVRF